MVRSTTSFKNNSGYENYGVGNYSFHWWVEELSGKTGEAVNMNYAAGARGQHFYSHSECDSRAVLIL
ncbi:hypothetical protein J2S74_000089 [Evansella vedderi]|uniref:Uncharacterized protein n=1 Tax=Evansella vedderi TaxID=38282 RepID=A0ABT9ZPS8_9BACI|nr:hypothetical protein [Evansella vedderi]MDQ0252717.1 hypothetical protein [Evansella vedderi]